MREMPQQDGTEVDAYRWVDVDEIPTLLGIAPPPWLLALETRTAAPSVGPATTW